MAEYPGPQQQEWMNAPLGDSPDWFREYEALRAAFLKREEELETEIAELKQEMRDPEAAPIEDKEPADG